MAEADSWVGNTSRLRPPARVQVIVTATLVAAIIAAVLSIVFDVQRISVVNQITADAAAGNAAGLIADHANAVTSDQRTALAGVLEGATLVVTGIAFLIWFFRAYANLPALGATHLRYRTGWAVGAWFIPVLSWFQPKRIANDIWRGSEPDANPDSEPNWVAPVSPLPHWWWAALLTSGFLGQAARLTWRSGTASGLLGSSEVDIASAVASCVAAVLAVTIVHRTTARQEQRAALRFGSEEARVG